MEEKTAVAMGGGSGEFLILRLSRARNFILVWKCENAKAFFGD